MGKEYDDTIRSCAKIGANWTRTIMRRERHNDEKMISINGAFTDWERSDIDAAAWDRVVAALKRNEEN